MNDSSPGLPHWNSMPAKPISWLAIGLALYGALLGLDLFAVPEGHAIRLPLLLFLYLGAAVFAISAMVGAAGRHAGWQAGRSGPERQFWATLAAGVALRVLGDLGWALYTLADPAPATAALYQTAWVASYLLLFAALAMFIARVNRRLALIAVLDSVAVLMTVGIMAYYFVLAPVLESPDGLASGVWIGFPSLVPELLRRPVADVTLFFLTLVVLSAEYKPRSAGLVSVAFLSFCIADALLWRVSTLSSTYQMDNALGAFWALGLICFGLAALSSLSPTGEGPQQPRRSGLEEVLAGDVAGEPWRAVLFWLGPLSPAMLYVFLLAWSLIVGELTTYIGTGAMLLLAYLAARIAVVLYVNRRLIREKENEARRAERGRIAGELDDALQKSVHAIPTLLDSYRASQPTDPERATRLLDRIDREAREASYRVSYPVRELRALSGETALGPGLLVEQLLAEIENNFGIKIHRRLQASPEDLTEYELASAYRIVSEALFNAAKHSGAANIWVTSTYVGSVFLVKVFDDGRGFDTGAVEHGLGIPLMRSRAAAMGAALDLISNPGRGTTVQIRFDAGQRARHEVGPQED